MLDHVVLLVLVEEVHGEENYLSSHVRGKIGNSFHLWIEKFVF